MFEFPQNNSMSKIDKNYSKSKSNFYAPRHKSHSLFSSTVHIITCLTPALFCVASHKKLWCALEDLK